MSYSTLINPLALVQTRTILVRRNHRRFLHPKKKKAVMRMRWAQGHGFSSVKHAFRDRTYSRNRWYEQSRTIEQVGFVLIIVMPPLAFAMLGVCGRCLYEKRPKQRLSSVIHAMGSSLPIMMWVAINEYNYSRRKPLVTFHQHASCHGPLRSSCSTDVRHTRVEAVEHRPEERTIVFSRS